MVIPLSSQHSLQTKVQTLDNPPDLGDQYAQALPFVRQSRITDCEFIYTPSQIAFAALHLQAPDATLRWAESKGMKTQKAEQVTSDIRALISRDGSPPDVESVREVDRRLRNCKNPHKTVGSSVYEQRLAEQDSQAMEKRVSKALATRLSMENEDPFGGKLRESNSEKNS